MKALHNICEFISPNYDYRVEIHAFLCMAMSILTMRLLEQHVKEILGIAQKLSNQFLNSQKEIRDENIKFMKYQQKENN